MSTFTHPESLVSTQWVAEHLNDPNVRIVEVIWGSQDAYEWEAYAAGHIPVAVAWDYEADYQEAQGDRQHDQRCIYSDGLDGFGLGIYLLQSTDISTDPGD